MMSAEMFEMIEGMLRGGLGFRSKQDQPAGGIQLIVCGDFFQLPPICKVNFKAATTAKASEFTNFGYAFQAPSWRTCFAEADHVFLTRIFRQSDVTFSTTLNDIRTGNDAMAAMTRLVKTCSRPVTCAEGIKPTQVFARNADVDRINATELEALEAPVVISACRDDVSVSATVSAKIKEVAKASAARANVFEQFVNVDSSSSSAPMNNAAVDKITKEFNELLQQNDFFRDCPAGREVALKVGAQVMLLKNMSTTLVNGSRGVVIGFVEKEDALETARYGSLCMYRIISSM